MHSYGSVGRLSSALSERSRQGWQGTPCIRTSPEHIREHVTCNCAEVPKDLQTKLSATTIQRTQSITDLLSRSRTRTVRGAVVGTQSRLPSYTVVEDERPQKRGRLCLPR